MKLYIGTYTTRLDGPGLTMARLRNDKITVTGVAKELQDPLYAALSKDGQRLYALGVRPDGEAVCALYDTAGDAPQYLGAGRLGAPDCCHIELSPDERFVYAACYATGRVCALEIRRNRVSDAFQAIQLTGGSGVHPRRQEKAHAHQITLVPGNDRLANVVDLGSDVVITYERNAQDGSLTEKSRMATPPGSGPRHIDYAPDGRHAYLAYELGNSVSVLEMAGEGWRIVQTLSAIPEGYAGETYCGAIRYDAIRKRVYVTNRGHNSIAAFDVLPDFRLALQGFLPCGGDFPRDLWVLPDGRLLAANQISGTVALITPEGQLVDSASVKGAVSVCCSE